MADEVYADGTLSTGANDGTSWADAYQGAAGLQTALDNVTDGNDTDMFIRNTFSTTSEIAIDTAAGDAANDKWLKIIGCDASGVELADGLYVDIDRGGGNSDILTIGGVDNVWLKHLHITDLNTAVVWLGITLGTGNNYVIDRCKTSLCNVGVSMGANTKGIMVIGSDISGRDTGISTYGNLEVYGSIVSVYGGGASDYAIDVTGTQCCLHISNCVLTCGGAGTDAAINTTGTDAFVIAHNNIFYDVVTGIYVDNVSAALVEYNNIYLLNDPDNHYAVDYTTGTIIYSDYSAVNRASGAFNGMTEGANVVKFTAASDIWADAASDDFRVMDAGLLRGGRPDRDGNLSQIGAILRQFQFTHRSRAVNRARLTTLR